MTVQTNESKKLPCRNLRALKTSKKDCTLFTELRGRDTRALPSGHYHESSNCFKYPNKSLLKSSHTKEYLPNFPTRKIPESKISNPKNSFDHPSYSPAGSGPHSATRTIVLNLVITYNSWVQTIYEAVSNRESEKCTLTSSKYLSS